MSSGVFKLNIWECIIDASNETEAGIPSSTSAPTINEFIRWSNKAQGLIVKETGCLEQLLLFSSVAKQEKYDLPSRFISPVRAEWIQGTSNTYPLHYKDLQAYRRLQEFQSGSGMNPGFFTIWNKNFYIYPTLSSSAGATTLDGDHTAVISTITVASASSFPTRGRVKIGDEVISYTNTTTTTLTGCVRGSDGTLAAAHSDTDAVTELDIRVYSTVRHLVRDFSVYNTGTINVVNGSANVEGTSTFFTTNVYTQPTWELGVGADPTKWYEIKTVASDDGAGALVLDSVYGEANASISSYVAVPVLEIPEEYSDLITLYLIHRTWKRMEERDKATATYLEFKSALLDCRAEMIDRGNIYQEMQENDEW